jgi:periplasmic protein TonB
MRLRTTKGHATSGSQDPERGQGHSKRRAIQALTMFGCAALLAACATHEAPPASSSSTASRQPAPRPGPAPNAASAAASSARSVEDYKREVALRIQQRNPAWVHDERPQALLRAVIVARIKVDASGNPQIEIVRSPDAEMSQRVVQSVRAAAPLPAPPRALAAQLSAGYTESWLFNTDGRFQIRTVARPQMNE